MSNDHLLLISGKTATGKSTSFMQYENPEGVLYLNCESGKKLPFRSKFIEKKVTHPLQVLEAFKWADTQDSIHTIIVDSLTYLLDMYESLLVISSTNTMKAWSEFAQYFKNLMQDSVTNCTKNVIFTAHTLDILNENEMAVETKVPVKGALKNNGLESYFSVVVSTKKMPLKKLADYSNDLLHITEEEELLGYKYVFQTRLTKDTVHERIRSPIGLFSIKETFIDNNTDVLMKRLHAYYAN